MCKLQEHVVASAAAAGASVTYRVLVQTSDVRGAGTDSNVYITLYGDKGDSGERQIESGANNFERGRLDTFLIKVRQSHTRRYHVPSTPRRVVLWPAFGL